MIRIRPLGMCLMAILTVTACASGDPSRSVSAKQEVETTSEVETSSGDPEVDLVPQFEGNPGDILTLSHIGESSIILHYASYEQMRDYSDVVVVATLASAKVAQTPSTDGFRSGHLVVQFEVDHQVGGRLVAGASLDVVLPLDADADLTAEVLDRQRSMYGKARYLLFLRRATPVLGSDNGPLYTTTIQYGAPGILAFWPGDGRLSPVSPGNDLARDAVRRGEERTGVDDDPFEIPGPNFEGAEPIGLTESEVVSRFATEVGTTQTEPPIGWDAYLRAATEAGAYTG